MKQTFNNIKTALIPPFLLVALVLLCSAVKAQNIDPSALKNSTAEQRAALQTKIMNEELKLNDAQFQQISKVNLLYAQKMQPLIGSDDSKFSKAKKAKQLFSEKEKQLKIILTEKQFELYQANVKEKISMAKQAYKSKK